MGRPLDRPQPLSQVVPAPVGLVRGLGGERAEALDVRQRDPGEPFGLENVPVLKGTGKFPAAARQIWSAKR